MYKSAAEARLRLKNFRGFVHEMAKANDEDADVEYGVTFFADLSEDEAQQYYGAGNLSEVEAPAPEETPPVEGAEVPVEAKPVADEAPRVDAE